MTDADVDGSHIRTLLLTFFFRQMPELIRRGTSTSPSRRCTRSSATRSRATCSTNARWPAGERRLPLYRVSWQGGMAHAWSESQCDEILKANTLHDASVSESEERDDATAPASVRQLHENRELLALFGQLSELGLEIDDYALTHEEAVTGEKLPTKYAWIEAPRGKQHQGEGEDDDAPGGRVTQAANIPEILTSLLAIGRRGMMIKRYKGLGEMDAQELWDTTMDPGTRTLLRVQWDDASAADELFTILMGENVEQRRQYIEDHALEVKSLDV
jgi:DNA gyrase subunit B